MAVEIERRFLINKNIFPWAEVGKNTLVITQAYLNHDPVVRIRIIGHKEIEPVCYLTIKGKAADVLGVLGYSRPEFEYEIPFKDASDMLSLIKGTLILKTRQCIEYRGLTWEVDVFSGPNNGLIIAEVELSDEHQAVELPPWVDAEITHDHRYSNSSLSLKPYLEWNKDAG